MSIEYRGGDNKVVSQIPSYNMPKYGAIGYVAYRYTLVRGFNLIRYLPVDTLAEVELYLTELNQRSGVADVFYVAR